MTDIVCIHMRVTTLYYRDELTIIMVLKILIINFPQNYVKPGSRKIFSAPY